MWAVGPFGALRHRNLAGLQTSTATTSGTVRMMRMEDEVGRLGSLVLLESTILRRSWQGIELVRLACA